MSCVLVVAPHPDDETLGCAGTLLRHKSRGDSIHWLIVSSIDRERYGPAQVERREMEITQVAEAYKIDSAPRLQFPTARLDEVPTHEFVGAIGQIIHRLEPNVIYLPFPGDAHSDHRSTYLASVAATKCFRYPSVQRILVYEVLSETDFDLNPDSLPFKPNTFVEVGPWIDKKIEIMSIYASEMGRHPFPRSEAAIRALAVLRGSQAGCGAAEAFMLLKEIIR